MSENGRIHLLIAVRLEIEVTKEENAVVSKSKQPTQVERTGHRDEMTFLPKGNRGPWGPTLWVAQHVAGNSHHISLPVSVAESVCLSTSILLPLLRRTYIGRDTGLLM